MRKAVRKKKLSKAEIRSVEVANIMLATDGTVRSVAKEIGMSKSSVYMDVAIRLKAVDKRLYNKVRKLIDKNKEERAYRGGNATKTLYEHKRAEKELA